MRRIIALAAGLAALSLGIRPAAAADSGFADPTCVQASAPVRAYADKTKAPDTTIADAVTAAQRVVDAYDQCATEKLSAGQTETMQYAQLTEAEYVVLIGNWQHLDGNDGLARAAWQKAQKLADEIAGWHPMSQSYYASNDVNVGSDSSHNPRANGVSRYHDDAVKVRDACAKAIAALGKGGAAPPPAAPAAPH